ncbi:MAG: c-type cytochrome [Verrucomicrobiales bacterium]
MFRFALAASTLAIAAATLAAEPPLVPAFARFHAAEPTAESGRLLLGELNCTRCHAAEGGSPKGAPILDGVGARLQADWLREFLTNPPAARPGTTMPDVLADLGEAERAAAVEALVHFLASQKSGWKPPKLAKYSAPHTGGALFQRVGCAACHADPLKSEPSPNASRGGVGLARKPVPKYSYPALAPFLQSRSASPRRTDAGFLALLPQGGCRHRRLLLDTLDLAENDSRAPPRIQCRCRQSKGQRAPRSSGQPRLHRLYPLADQQPALEPPPLAALIGSRNACRLAAYPHSAPQRAALDKALAARCRNPMRRRARHALAALVLRLPPAR